MFTVKRIEEIVRQLSQLRYPVQLPLSGWQMRRSSGESRPAPSDVHTDWQPIPTGSIWGGHNESCTFTARVTIPDQLAGKPVDFCLRTGKEGQWDANNPQFTVYVGGVLRQGFDVNHTALRLTDCAEAGAVYDLFLSAFTGVQNFHLLFQPNLRAVDEAADQLYYDLSVPCQTLRLLQREDSAWIRLADVLTRAVNVLDLRKPGSAAYCNSIAQARQLLARELYDAPGLPESTTRCVGHTHIDVAWLWTLAVTEDKSVRSFSTVLELMRRYPEYIFMSSQPQLYQYVKKNAPEIFEQIKARVAEGRWEPEGAMFVEPDCNLASGEALVRQILVGKGFFRREFGKDNQILWLPDVFGYAAALPQIMKKSGIDYFMTTKISWNEVNKQPYDTFYWKGIDGTKILTHFIPTKDYVMPGTAPDTREFNPYYTTYVGMLAPSQIKGGWQRYQQKQLNSEVLCCYGYGDGGGGPTDWMLENQRRMARGIPGCPQTKPSTALDFFHQLEQDLQGKKVPTWAGELYLEYHRGTYTSMARNKKWNRRAEFALTNAETQGVLAGRLCGLQAPELSEAWEILLRNQFHDILPGSSIYEVYEDSKAEYAKLFKIADGYAQTYLRALADGVGQTIVYNPNGQTLSGLVTLPDAQGRTQVQPTADGCLAWAEAVPAKGYAVQADTAPASGPVCVTPTRVQTPFADLTLNEKGHITAWYDKTARRQLLQPGQSVMLMTYEDKPFQYDNWNLQDYYKEKPWPVEDLLSARVTEEGPLRWALELCWQYQDTRIEQTLWFYGHTPRVDIRFRTDWKEDQVLLKALLPLELNTNEATFEIQYGNVKRSTAVNTSWDAARFEVCHQKWLDLSEGGFGVSLLNDCKYGVSVEENVVGLSLLRSGRYPNPQADREPHEAVYSILPHTGTWQEAGTVAQAYLLNNPLQAVPAQGGGDLPQHFSLVSHDHRNIMVEAVKQAESGEGTVIRFYEFENTRTDVQLRLPDKAGQIWLCSLMEDKQQLLAENTDTVTVPTDPFGIMTILITND